MELHWALISRVNGRIPTLIYLLSALSTHSSHVVAPEVPQTASDRRHQYCAVDFKADRCFGRVCPTLHPLEPCSLKITVFVPMSWGILTFLLLLPDILPPLCPFIVWWNEECVTLPRDTEENRICISLMHYWGQGLPAPTLPQCKLLDRLFCWHSCHLSCSTSLSRQAGLWQHAHGTNMDRQSSQSPTLPRAAVALQQLLWQLVPFLTTGIQLHQKCQKPPAQA